MKSAFLLVFEYFDEPQTISLLCCLLLAALNSKGVLVTLDNRRLYALQRFALQAGDRETERHGNMETRRHRTECLRLFDFVGVADSVPCAGALRRRAHAHKANAQLGGSVTASAVSAAFEASLGFSGCFVGLKGERAGPRPRPRMQMRSDENRIRHQRNACCAPTASASPTAICPIPPILVRLSWE